MLSAKSIEGRRMKKHLFILILCMPLILISCGSSHTIIDLTMSDYKFTPDTITTTAGEEVTLNLTNKGFVSHKFVIFKLGTTAGQSFGHEDEKNIYWSFEVLPGHFDSAAFTVPSEPGEYFVSCGIQGHIEVGMVGKLIVVAKK